MRKDAFINALKNLRATAPKRKFSQSVELMINFTGVDTRKPVNQINLRISLPNPTGKGSGKVAVFAKTDELIASLKNKVDKVISDKEIEGIAKNKTKLNELLSFDALFAEGPCMLTVAKFLGQQLAPKGKMPKPIISAALFEEDLARARTQITVSNKKGKFMPVVHALVGNEGMSDEKIVENIVIVYDTVMNSLPQKKQNIKNVYIKFTMSPAILVGGEDQ